MSTRYMCSNRPSVHCDSGTGKPPKKCSHCGSRIYSEEGKWGLFDWNKEGRYPADAAHKIYASKAAAEKAAGLQYVVRFVKA